MPIYLDNNSTTAPAPAVVARMMESLRGRYGNPASREHGFGWDASDDVEEARERVAALAGANPPEIIFTSGGTEAIHLALDGLFPEGAPPAGGIVASAVEHGAMLDACRSLRQERGVPLELAGVDASGRLDMQGFETLLQRRRPKVAVLMAANNETGVIFPIREAAAIAHAHDALLFVDAVQALGRIPMDAAKDGFDLAAFSAHKLHGPKGAGALFARGGPGAIPLRPMFSAPGGRLRPGTTNVPGIVGFGEACRLARDTLAEELRRIGSLRDRLERSLSDRVPGIGINGDIGSRLPNTSNIAFPGVRASELLRAAPAIAASTRSACSTGSGGPSHVLKAMGRSDEWAMSSIRFSLGAYTTESEVDEAAEIIAAAHLRLSERS
jgi:cysteine desulfurase